MQSWFHHIKIKIYSADLSLVTNTCKTPSIKIIVFITKSCQEQVSFKYRSENFEDSKHGIHEV